MRIQEILGKDVHNMKARSLNAVQTKQVRAIRWDLGGVQGTSRGVQEVLGAFSTKNG